MPRLFLDPVLRIKPLDFDRSTHPSLPSMTTCLSPCWRKPSWTPPSTSVPAPTLVAIRHPVSFRDLFWDLGIASGRDQRSWTPPSTSVPAPTLVAIRHPVSFRDLFWDLGIASVISAVSPSCST
jgi:hypothetical protein